METAISELTLLSHGQYRAYYHGHSIAISRCRTRWQAWCTGLVGNRGILKTGYCLTPERALEVAKEKIDSGEYSAADW